MKPITKKTRKMKHIEETTGVRLEEYLRRLFVDENQSIPHIADLLSISYPMVFEWLQKAGIYSRQLHIDKE